MNYNNLKKEDVQTVTKKFPIKLRRGLIAITLNILEEDELELTEEKQLDETQFVVSIGDMVKDLKECDKVGLNLSAMFTHRRLSTDSDQSTVEPNFKTFEVEGTLFGIIDERVVEYIYK